MRHLSPLRPRSSFARPPLARPLLARLIPPILVLGLAAAPALAQDATVIGKDTILPGTGPGTGVDGSGGALMEAADATDAAKRQNLKPAVVLGSKIIGIDVSNPAGESVGKVADLLIVGGALRAVVLDVGGTLGIGGKRIAVGPSALVLRPGGERYAAVLNMGSDAIAAAQPFDPAKLRAAN